jgi:hypothetical protein
MEAVNNMTPEKHEPSIWRDPTFWVIASLTLAVAVFYWVTR